MDKTVLNVAHLVTVKLNSFTAATTTQTSFRPVHDPDVKAVDDTELEDMALRLLSVAKASNRNITIDNKGIPQFGMGGYYPVVVIRADHPTVRQVYNAIEARKEGREAPPAQLPKPSTLRLLRCANVYWGGSSMQVQNNVLTDPSHLPHHQLVELVREYDRRLYQLLDKVGFERERGLLDYSKLGGDNASGA